VHNALLQTAIMLLHAVLQRLMQRVHSAFKHS
jgi:hypothetical protein